MRKHIDVIVQEVRRLYTDQDMAAGGYAPGEVIIVSDLFAEGSGSGSNTFTYDEAMEKIQECHNEGMGAMAAHFEAIHSAFQDSALHTVVMIFKWEGDQ